MVLVSDTIAYMLIWTSNIVEKLEAACPTPSLHLDDSLQQKAQDISNQIIFPVVAWMFNRIYSEIITEEEKEWFRKDRESRGSAMMGRDHISLEEWEKETGGKGSFEASEPGMAKLSKLLRDHKRDNGPFILGSQVCYADLMVGGLAEAFRRIGDGAYEKLMESVVGLKELCESCSLWFQRNNY